jgi:hypothetical protein
LLTFAFYLSTGLLVDRLSEPLNEGRYSLGPFKSGTRWATILALNVSLLWRTVGEVKSTRVFKKKFSRIQIEHCFFKRQPSPDPPKENLD